MSFSDSLSNVTLELSQTLNRSSPRKFKTSSNYVQSDITNRSFNFQVPEKDTTTKSVQSPRKEVAVAQNVNNESDNMSLMKLDDSPVKQSIDRTVLADLEKYLLEKDTNCGKNSNIPVLEPPPQHSKISKKNGIGSELAKLDNGKL